MQGGRERKGNEQICWVCSSDSGPVTVCFSQFPVSPEVPSMLQMRAMQNVEAVGRMQKSNFPAIAAKVHATNFAHVEWSGYRVDHEAWHDA